MERKAGQVVLLLLLVATANAQTWKEHLENGNKALAAGDLSGALTHYHAACDAGPKEYTAFFRRATVYLAMGKSRLAIKDLDTVLELKPDFISARQRRVGLLVKQGAFAAARADFAELTSDPGTPQAVAEMNAASEAMEDGQAAMAEGQYAEALRYFNIAVQVVSSDAKLRLDRARCLQALGQNGEAVGDAMRATKLQSANTEAYFLLSQLYYTMGERQDALAQIRECVKLDEGNKECFKLYQKLKKFNKIYDKITTTSDQGRHGEMLMHLEKARAIEKEERFYVLDMQTKECVALTALGRHPLAMEACNKALDMDPANKKAMMSRAKVHENLGDFAQSVADWQAAAEMDSDDRAIKEGLDRAQKLLKNAQKRDYYKILGVPRNANKKQITKAYREMAIKWHPDKFESEEDKKMAEIRFMDIASAKEVLTDPDKRAMFDNGEDPLDAEEERERQSRGHNPFGGGFNPFGGGGGGGGQRFHFRYQ